MAHLTKYTQKGMPMEGMTSYDLVSLGRDIPVYPGVESLFKALKGLGVEIYIVSSGLKELLEEHPIAQMADKIFASSYSDKHLSWPSEVVTPIDKIRALYEISKGCHIHGIHPTAEVPNHLRRIPFSEILYCGDGPSDSYAFGKVVKSGGHTVGVWDPQVPASFDQIETLRKNGLLSFVGTPNFHPETGSTGNWILNKVIELQSKSVIEADREQIQLIEKIQNQRPEFVHPWSNRRFS
jgi:hypothetical protein